MNPENWTKPIVKTTSLPIFRQRHVTKGTHLIFISINFLLKICQKVEPHLKPCLSYSCLNGATCTLHASNQAVCLCKPGFKGQLCERFDSCYFKPCLNGSECRAENFPEGDRYACIFQVQVTKELGNLLRIQSQLQLLSWAG